MTNTGDILGRAEFEQDLDERFPLGGRCELKDGDHQGYRAALRQLKEWFKQQGEPYAAYHAGDPTKIEITNAEARVVRVSDGYRFRTEDDFVHAKLAVGELKSVDVMECGHWCPPIAKWWKADTSISRSKGYLVARTTIGGQIEVWSPYMGLEPIDSISVVHAWTCPADAFEVAMNQNMGLGFEYDLSVQIAKASVVRVEMKDEGFAVVERDLDTFTSHRA